jgi:hypothetical protein
MSSSHTLRGRCIPIAKCVPQPSSSSDAIGQSTWTLKSQLVHARQREVFNLMHTSEIFNLMHTPCRHADIYGSMELKVAVQHRYSRTSSSKPGTHELQFPKFSMPWGRPDQLPSGRSRLADLLQVHGNQRSEIQLVKSEICITRFRLPSDEIVIAFEKEKVNQDLSSSISSCTLDPFFRHSYTNFAGHACMSCDLIKKRANSHLRKVSNGR